MVHASGAERNGLQVEKGDSKRNTDLQACLISPIALLVTLQLQTPLRRWFDRKKDQKDQVDPLAPLVARPKFWVTVPRKLTPSILPTIQCVSLI